MRIKNRMIVESLEDRAMLAASGVAPPADVCETAPNNPNCAVIGDVDGDGFFTTSDFIAVLSAGKFGTGAPAEWNEGDWNRDGVADASDLDLAFAQGYFESPELTFETFIPGLAGKGPHPGH